MSGRYLNVVTGERRDRLPDGARHGEWWGIGTGLLATLEVDRSELPLPALSHAIRETAEQLKTAPGKLLAPGLEDAVRWSEIDTELEDALGPVADACRAPRSYLKFDEEVHAVGRVRRMAGRAEEHLSAHPEQWHRRTLTSIAPRSVLARVVADELDVYENRVLATAVEAAERNLTQRIRAVDEAQAALDEIAEAAHSGSVGTANFRTNRRLSSLWGEGYEPDAAEAEGRKTLSRLRTLRAHYRELTSRPLFRALPRSSRATGPVRATNILTHDGNYRTAARLLSTLRKLAGSQDLAARLREESETALAWRQWVRALVEQSLLQLRDDAVQQGAWFRLFATCSLREEHGALLVTCGGDLLRVVALPAVLTSVPARVASAPTVVVVPQARPSEELTRAAWSNGVAFLPAGPFVLPSVERFSRVLRAWLARRELAAQGPQAASPLWAECPVCGKESGRRTTLKQRTDGLFEGSCSNCEATWESRRCRAPKCGKRYAVLHTRIAELNPFLEGLRSRDFFARPCGRFPRRFVCPECSHCDSAAPGEPPCPCSLKSEVGGSQSREGACSP